MKLTLNWLKEFVELKDSPQKLVEALTMAGLEVESLAPLRSPDGRGEDWLIDVAVTPNRGDCLGILGLAREVAALRGGRLRLPATKLLPADSKAPPVKVEIRSPRCCRRYSASIVESIQIGPSPAWMKSRLEACGIRSINNVVDVTNYVMLETGQPLHAFDLDRLAAKRIVVRQAKGSKKFVTLDGVERDLAPEDLLICDGDAPVALAGIMGGRDSEVRAETRAVLIESAQFDPATIRRTAKRLGLHSEASHRFERGVDPEGTIYALERASSLLAEVAGGRPLNVIDRYPRPLKPSAILLRHQRLADLIGIEFKGAEVEKNLRALGCKVRRRGTIGFNVVPPTYRSDLSREADLIEELARLRGYEKIPFTLPRARLGGAKPDARLRWERAIRAYLAGEGLTETIHLPFASAEMNARFSGTADGRKPVPVLNPLVQESAELRLSLIPGLIESLKINLAQRVKGFSAFALGKVFFLDPSPRERHHLAALLHGGRERIGLRAPETPFTFLDAKGLVEGILERVGAAGRSTWTDSGVPPFLHPGQAGRVELDGAGLGYVGAIHPDLSEALSLPRFFLFEVDFDGLVQYASHEIAIRSLPRFPSVERDLAVVVDESFPAQQIINWIKNLRHSLIEGVEVFDQYRGAPIPEGKKSLAYAISYRAENRTLTDSEVHALHQDLVSRISELFGARLRG
ncbi:MAG TPA: phenylalanine--tRNA ligase subunit beta [Candidatus Binatia bacterium]